MEGEEATVIIRVDGKLTRIPESQYEQLLKQGRIQPVGMLEEPKLTPILKEPPKAEEASTFTIEPKPEPELPEFLSQIDLELISGMMDYPPENFVAQLKSEVEQEVTQSALIWGFLSNTTYEEIVKFVTPYKGHSQIGFYVEKVLSEEGKKWTGRVIELMKEAK